MKPGYTIPQHEALGQELAKISDKMAEEIAKLSNAYPPTEKALKALSRSRKALDEARTLLDGTICRENPQADTSIVRAYYPVR